MDPIIDPEGKPDHVQKDVVTVTKKSGETTEQQISGLGKPFMVEGTKMYGYLRWEEEKKERRGTGRRNRRNYEPADHEDCLTFGNSGRPGCYGGR